MGVFSRAVYSPAVYSTNEPAEPALPSVKPPRRIGTRFLADARERIGARKFPFRRRIR